MARLITNETDMNYMLATDGKTHFGKTESRNFIIYKSSGIPCYTEKTFEFTDPPCVVGKGQFGEVKIGKLIELDLIIVGKVLQRSDRKAVLVETIANMSLRGNIHIPTCFGLYEKNVILLHYFLNVAESGVFNPAPTLHQLLKTKIPADKS